MQQNKCPLPITSPKVSYFLREQRTSRTLASLSLRLPDSSRERTTECEKGSLYGRQTWSANPWFDWSALGRISRREGSATPLVTWFGRQVKSSRVEVKVKVKVKVKVVVLP